MPQIFQVLRCYKCFVFQIHQTKKSNKWECKLCGEKQSVKRHYGIGNGKECRLHVQRLNRLRGENAANNSNTDDDNEIENDERIVASLLKGTIAKNDSKWSDYIDSFEEDKKSISTEPMYLGETEVVLEAPKKKKNKAYSTQNKIAILKTIDRSKTLKDNFNTDVICNESLVSPLLDKGSKCIEKSNIEKRETSVSNIIPSTINHNSKWAQYTNEEPTDHKNISLSITEVTKQRIPQGMFSLCEDSDLDNILDI